MGNCTLFEILCSYLLRNGKRYGHKTKTTLSRYFWTVSQAIKKLDDFDDFGDFGPSKITKNWNFETWVKISQTAQQICRHIKHKITQGKRPNLFCFYLFPPGVQHHGVYNLEYRYRCTGTKSLLTTSSTLRLLHSFQFRRCRHPLAFRLRRLFLLES